jgi:hypothetical protein
VNGKHRGGLGKQAVSRSREKSVADPTTSQPHNTTDNYEREGENAGGEKGGRICVEAAKIRDEARGDGDCWAQRSGSVSESGHAPKTPAVVRKLQRSLTSGRGLG